MNKWCNRELLFAQLRYLDRINYLLKQNPERELMQERDFIQLRIKDSAAQMGVKLAIE